MLGGKGALEGRTVPGGGALGLLNWDLPPLSSGGGRGGRRVPALGSSWEPGLSFLTTPPQTPHPGVPHSPVGPQYHPVAQGGPAAMAWRGGHHGVGGSPDDTGHPPDPGSLLPDAQPPCCPPQAAPQPPTMTSYRQELEKYRDIDEDKILRELSAEELEQLDMELLEMDPEVGPGAGGKRDGCHPAIRVPHG